MAAIATSGAITWPKPMPQATSGAAVTLQSGFDLGLFLPALHFGAVGLLPVPTQAAAGFGKVYRVALHDVINSIPRSAAAKAVPVLTAHG